MVAKGGADRPVEKQEPSSSSKRAGRETIHPAQSFFRASTRPILTPYPARVSHLVEHTKYIAVINFALVGFVTIRHARDLYMCDVVEILFERPLADRLQRFARDKNPSESSNSVRPLLPGSHGLRPGCSKRQPGISRLLMGSINSVRPSSRVPLRQPKVLDIHGAVGIAITAGWNDSTCRMQSRCVGGLRIFECARNCRAEFRSRPGSASHVLPQQVTGP